MTKILVSFILDHFHILLTMDQESLLHISNFILVSKISRSGSDPLPEFLQCGRHSKFGSTFGLSLPSLAFNCIQFYNLLPNFLNSKLT